MSGEMHNGRCWLPGEEEFERQNMEATLKMDHERMAMDVELEMRRIQFEIDNFVRDIVMDDNLELA